MGGGDGGGGMGGNTASGAGGTGGSTASGGGGSGGSTASGGSGGSTASGGSGGSDLTPPTVDSVSPSDGATAVAITPTVSVTFSEPMNAATITSNGACTGSMQVSANNFASCVAMNVATGNDVTFDLTPPAALASATQYKIRVSTNAEDQAGNALANTYETPNGFVVRYWHTVTIDGNNDFVAGAEALATSTGVGSLYVSFDDTNLYLGLAHPDVVTGGNGNKFAYFLLSTDASLNTGNTLSSDGKAKFGAAGTSRMEYHWKERIDGPNVSEYRIGNNSDWNTDWTANGKDAFRATGYLEGSIALSELGSPSLVIVTAYTIDYDGDGGNGWLYNMLSSASDGSGATPRDLVEFLQIDLPTSQSPNDAAHLQTF